MGRGYERHERKAEVLLVYKKNGVGRREKGEGRRKKGGFIFIFFNLFNIF